MVPVYYKGKLVARQRIDMLVDDRVIVESKATERLAPSAGPQLIGYLRATTYQVGVLLHFGPHPKFYRFVDSVKKIDTSIDRIRSDSRDSRPANSPSPPGGSSRSGEPRISGRESRE